jgi:hypothetical protein
MNAKELRIGNWYQWYAEGKYYEYQVEGIDLIQNYENFEPIPLTEDWLLKFGFKYDKPQDLYSHKSGHDLMFVKDGYVEFYLYEYGGAFKILEFVHQLQNLFFALTEQELIDN